jgi:uncharacterized membrane protein
MNAAGQKWLKCFHIFTACLWVGGAVALFIMANFMGADDGNALYGQNVAIKFVDDFIVVPGAIGLLITGLIYSIFTKWGWFKHGWIMVKWTVNLFGIVLGTFWLGPWTNSLPAISRIEGPLSLSNSVYLHNQMMMRAWGAFLLATIILALFASTLKPWKKR